MRREGKRREGKEREWKVRIENKRECNGKIGNRLTATARSYVVLLVVEGSFTLSPHLTATIQIPDNLPNA